MPCRRLRFGGTAVLAGFAMLVLMGPASAASAAADVSATPAASTPFAPNHHPTLDVPRASGEIRVDGRLDDAGWQGAARADNFCEVSPGDQTEPAVRTEVWVTYDDEYLYVAVLAADDPATIRASMSDRDEIFRDDYFGVILDTYGDAAWAYELFVNPLGFQGDLRWTPQGEDGNFDLVWHSKGMITADGYQVELAIPFSSLRFPDRPEQVWRATFWRDHQRGSRQRYSWAAIDRDEPCWLCNFGTLTGIRDVSPGRSLDLIGAVVGSQASTIRDDGDAESGLDHGDPQGEASLNVRYALSNSLSAEGSLNPDFSQVESDVARIDVNTTFALDYPEKRPFFLDGQDLFDTWIPAVYTRSINDPSAAVKLLGRMDRRNIAFLSAVDETSPMLLPFEERSEFVGADRSWSNILRYRQTFREDSHAGILATDRRLEGGGSGTVLGADTQLRFLKNYHVELQFAASHTEEPDDTTLTAELNSGTFDGGAHTAAFDGESFWGHAVYASLERDARYWNFDLDYGEYSPTFRADNGFVTRNDSREALLWTGVFFQPNGAVVDDWRPNFNAGLRWNFDGTPKTAWTSTGMVLQLKGQTSVATEWIFDNERFRDVDFRGMHRGAIQVDSRFSRPLQLGFWTEIGRYIARNEDPEPVSGDGINVEFWGTWKPVSRLTVEPIYRFSELKDLEGRVLFSGYLLRTRASYQFTRELFLRLVGQYNSFADRLSVEPLITYKINPFTAVYLGSTHAYEELPNPRRNTVDFTQAERQFFAKFQYLFQR